MNESTIDSGRTAGHSSMDAVASSSNAPITDRQKVTRLSEALLRLLHEPALEQRPYTGAGFEQARDALLQTDAYDLTRPSPDQPRLSLREIGDRENRTVELSAWNRLPHGWVGCRAEDESLCYFSADRWRPVHGADASSAMASLSAMSSLSYQFYLIAKQRTCSNSGCLRNASHVLLASDGATMPGGAVCEVCAQTFLSAQTDQPGKEWHAVAPISGCGTRDWLISLLIERLDIDAEDPDAHLSAMRKVVDYLSDYLGEPNTTPITLTHDDRIEELTRWYRLWRGWLGCRTASGKYEFFSEVNWSPLERASAG